MDAIEAVGAVLRAGGAVGGEFIPKVVRALGPQATAAPDPPLPEPVGDDEPVRCLVRDVLRRNVRALITHDVEVRRDLPDGVHQMRVSARRLRSALKTFAVLLDPEWAESLRHGAEVACRRARREPATTRCCSSASSGSSTGCPTT